MNNTNLVFVVGSGRCGTKMIKSLLAGVEHIEARHEYVRNAYQREAAMYYMGHLSYGEIAYKLLEVYAPAAHYSQASIFLDSSHKLAWCVDVLADIFPRAKFIHLVRDGRKVAESFFYKLNIFDEYSAGVLRGWLADDTRPIPPLEEKFWQPVSMYDTGMFQRVCHHWVDTNRNILKHLAPVANSRKLFVRLEDLAGDCATMARFLEFLDVAPPYDSFMEAMQKPKHVYVPTDYKLTDEQAAQFADICGDMMKQLGYDIESEEYRVKYQL